MKYMASNTHNLGMVTSIQKEAFLFGFYANYKHLVIIKRNLLKDSYGPIPAKDWRIDK